MSPTTESVSEPIVISPRRFKLPIPDNDWGWCKLDEVLLAARNITESRNLKWEITNPRDFVFRFCLLSNLQSVSEGKFFFSRGSTLVSHTHDELCERAKSAEFLGDDIYVPEGWVKVVLKVVERGGNRVFCANMESPGYPRVPNALLCTGYHSIVFFAVDLS